MQFKLGRGHFFGLVVTSALPILGLMGAVAIVYFSRPRLPIVLEFSGNVVRVKAFNIPLEPTDRLAWITMNPEVLGVFPSEVDENGWPKQGSAHVGATATLAPVLAKEAEICVVIHRETKKGDPSSVESLGFTCIKINGGALLKKQVSWSRRT